MAKSNSKLQNSIKLFNSPWTFLHVYHWRNMWRTKWETISRSVIFSTTSPDHSILYFWGQSPLTAASNHFLIQLYFIQIWSKHRAKIAGSRILWTFLQRHCHMHSDHPYIYIIVICMWTQPQLPPEPPRPGHSKPRPGQRVRVAERVCGAVGLRPLPRHYPPQHRLREPGRRQGGGGRRSRDGGAAHQHPGLAQGVQHSGRGEGEQVIRSVGNSQPASSFMFMRYSVKLKSNCRAVGVGRRI